MNERRKKLQETLKTFNKKNKDELITFGNNAQENVTISTGIKTFDNFIGGGVKKGHFTVIYGGQSVGKSTLVLEAIAKAQADEQTCCYIDLEHTFEKDRAISLGINLDELVLAEKCETAEQALEIIRALCKEKVVDLIVVDSVQAMSPINERENKGKERELASKEIAELARTLSKFFRVVAPDVYRAKASVIMIGQIRIAGIGSFYTHADMSGGEALKHWAYTRCFIRKGQGNDAPVKKFKEYMIDPEGKIRFTTMKEKIGFDAVIKLEKTKSSKSRTEGSEIHLPFLFEKGFVDEVIEDDNVPIKIDPMCDDQEKEMIKEYLIEKGLMTSDAVKDACHKLAHDDKAIKEIADKFIESTATLDKTACAVLNLDKKKKRGRPKKEK